MTLAGAFKSSSIISWKSTGKLQQTLANCIERTGKALHSGSTSTVKISPESAGVGRYFVCRSQLIPASIEFARESPLCTTLHKDGHSVRTVEHMLSALEATGVDNCRIEVKSSDSEDPSVEVPILDGSAREWVEAIEQVGLKVATDQGGNNCEKMAPFLNETLHVRKNDSFVAAIPSSEVHITCGIDFSQVPAIGCQWFSSFSVGGSFYAKQIAPSRTFCIYEEVQRMRDAGLIKGGSEENAIVCSTSRGWLNPPLRFQDEPCRHKVLDLIGDFSLFARCGSQGLPVAHLVAYKSGHALHADFVRCLLRID
ncbi:probable UDP-3-O-acyl-N-acetylglucosamine deacetylase 1, mitochondrial isoform X1 [Rhododendron vialii]|uniref:probable UDP-3-O-acyl-N-acetylglucosamine deacetylase 1, mitochondrial isoform X1 n=1 Tax=Rhododendron vialii TaxID=182163 RepID=UPI00265E9459|nr:probable UDP-3-O-acyl-N-acetylglucosamine deacetylase 1, mitochondrial isoform X1 [Rhododendron vialii]